MGESGCEPRCEESSKNAERTSTQRTQDFEGLFRFGPDGVVRVGGHVADDPPRVDNDPRGEGQLPRVVAVEVGEDDPEVGVDFAQVFGQALNDGELPGISVAEVAQQGEIELVLAFGFVVLFRKLGRDRHEFGAEVGHRAIMLLQSIQLHVAVRSPDAAVEGDDQRSFFEEPVGVHGPPVGAGQFEGGERRARRRDARQDVRGAEFLGSAAHDGFRLVGGALDEACLDPVQTLLQSAHAFFSPSKFVN